jgi:hypothetical protein
MSTATSSWPGTTDEPGHPGRGGLEYFRWWVVDEGTGERQLTTYKLSRADAARAYPGAEPGLETREWRSPPGTGDAPPSSRPGTPWY